MRWRLLAWGLVGYVVLGVGLAVWPLFRPSLEIDIRQRGGQVLLIRDETLLVGAMLEGPQFGDADATKLARASSIRNVSFQGSLISRDGLQRLLPLTDLRALNLSRTQLVPESLDDVARFTSLQQLNLARCLWFRDDDLRRLGPLQQLEDLDLSSTGIGAAGVEHLRQLPSLRSLKLDHCFMIRDDVIEALCRLPKIEVLDLTLSEISSRGLARLRQELPKATILLPVDSLSDVRHLSSKFGLGGSTGETITSMSTKSPIDGLKPQLSPGDLGGLALLTDINSIVLNQGNVDDAMLLELGTRPALLSLSLQSTLITDDGLKALAGFPNLKTLRLYGTRFEGPGLRHLSHLTQLENLSLDSVRSEDELLDALPQLTRLDRLGVHAPMTDAGLLRLPSLPQLSMLSIYDARITGPGLASLTRAPKLTQLSLSETPLQDDSFVEGLAQLKSLNSVYLHRTGVTRAGCERLKKLHPNLNVQWCDPDSSVWVTIE
ncbi:MAG: hypothetical protein AABP62_09855 [Planctomycetota bacterium]